MPRTLCKKTLARARPVVVLVLSNVAASKLFTEMYAQKKSEIEAAVRALPSGRHFGTAEDSVAELSFVAPDSKSRSNKRTRSGYEAESSQKKTAIKIQSTRMLTWTHQGIFTCDSLLVAVSEAKNPRDASFASCHHQQGRVIWLLF